MSAADERSSGHTAARYRRAHAWIVPDSARELPRIQSGEPVSPSSPLWARLSAGGPAGNEILTGVTGALLLILLGVEGITIVRIGQLLWLHMFLGMALIPVITLKLASTGYRFARYYTGNAPYVRRGPPPIALRLIAPIVVLTSVVVFASGVILLFAGPGSRSILLPVHKVSFIVWLVFTSVHALGHFVELGPLLRAEYRSPPPGGAALAHTPSSPVTGDGAPGGAIPGRSPRQMTLLAATVAGVLVAAVVLPEFGAWLHSGLLHHHHHH